MTDPMGPSSASSRIFRGSGYCDWAEWCRSADRAALPLTSQAIWLAFGLSFPRVNSNEGTYTMTSRFKHYLAGKLLPVLLVLWICLQAVPGSALPVTQEKALGIAENFLAYKAAAGSFTVKQVVPKVFSGQTAGYLAELSPDGYILVAADTIRVPVKAHSFESDFNDLPP